MKLSMWMIANRLSGFPMELSIGSSAPVVLRSARRAYSTDCVRVYQEGNQVVCAGEGDAIRLSGVSLAEGFEIIQGIFDFYEDWSEALDKAILARNYQKVVELGHQIFGNPAVLMDGNNRVLGITRQYAPDSMDAEWAYLYRYGYTSMNAAQQLQLHYKNVSFWRRGIQHFPANTAASALGFGGATYSMYFQDAACGRLTVLEKDRPLNRGDDQIIDYICRRLEPALGSALGQECMSNINVFHHLLLGERYEPGELDKQLANLNWGREDSYSLALMELSRPRSGMDLSQNGDMLTHVILTQIRGCVVVHRQTQLLIFSNRNLAADETVARFFHSLGKGNPIRVSFSLPCKGIEGAPNLYRQAAYAMASGKAERPEERFYRFQDWAVDYLLESPALTESAAACMPAVVGLWEARNTGGEQFQTLKAYLENERSVSKTADTLFTHRNTVIYRLKKIEEALGQSLDDPKIREYARASIHVLELCQRKRKAKI